MKTSNLVGFGIGIGALIATATAFGQVTETATKDKQPNKVAAQPKDQKGDIKPVGKQGPVSKAAEAQAQDKNQIKPKNAAKAEMTEGRSEKADQTQYGAGFVDADGDGICDNARKGQSAAGQGKASGPKGRLTAGGAAGSARGGLGRGADGYGPGFVDADGDGVCDKRQRQGSGRGNRRGRGQGRGANGYGPGFIDADGDGICDNFQRRACCGRNKQCSNASNATGVSGQQGSGSERPASGQAAR